MAGPAIEYLGYLIERCTDQFHHRDGSRTILGPDFCCAGASPDECGGDSYGGSNPDGVHAR
ncbi:hypothetical protein [Mycolicibacterium confluentis]|uniref:Uncharacterized protein n=1 Tax=Mycolicibacterium confluentis TaxID=28047 RepID=A0A7I7XYN9_9MYCO|nr:hypothetical protein [Mycolicibacterium confluentis]BBZ34465.1 hypothetical protein MCNF_30700 [Mycolicibacterium confluentis]